MAQHVSGIDSRVAAVINKAADDAEAALANSEEALKVARRADRKASKAPKDDSE